VVLADAKPLAWVHGEIKTPPLSEQAQIEAGFLLRRLQQGDPDAIVIGEVFDKKTRHTPRDVIEACKRRLSQYDQATEARS